MEKYLDKFYDYAPNILAALIIYAVGYIVIRLTVKFLKTVFMRSKIDETGWRFILSAVRAAMYVILIVMILSQLKVPMSSIVAALGTAGLAIGLALRDSLSNVAGGFIVMFSKPFKAGDYIEINGKEGKVDRITILNTRLLTLDNKAVIIPNSTVANATVTNYTQEDFRRLELRFSVSYEEDFRRAESTILRTVEASPFALDKPDKPYIRICEHSDSAIIILLRVWVKTENYWELRYSLLADVKEAFDSEGISIPYPQLDLHNIVDREK